MDRIIFHIDVNNAFLSWTAIELLQNGYKYDIRDSYAVIGGDPKLRKGIVLAKSNLCKKLGIYTSETLYSAKKKCPNLKVYPPNYEFYQKMSNSLFNLLSKYTPDIEIASIDECYLDYGKVKRLYGDEIEFAKKIQKEIYDTLGFTVNIGIANNKLCAKMASDFSKPNKIHTLYKNEIEAIELNGNGDINWDKTIEQIDPMVFNKQWIYADFITNKSIVDENKFITLIHGTILNECINILKKYHLDLFINCNEEVVEKTLENLDEEDIEVLENEIDKEIAVQFNDRKRRVLYAMKSYLNRRCDIGESDLILFGTRNFKWIWEVICGYVFKNEFVNNGKNSKYEVFNITPPKWNINGSNVGNKDTTDLEMKKNRLTPDILRTVILPEGKKLLILDAKYYNIRFDLELGKVLGNPGIEDITKQYLYKVALKNYISKNTIGNDVFNAFLFPTMEPSNVQGYVKLDFMDEYCSDGIKLIMLNVEEIIDKYCNNVTYEMKDIQGFILN